MSDELTASPSAAPLEPAPVQPPPPIPVSDLRCASHHAVPAVYSCDRCGAHLCPTCVFELPGPRHLCPSCAVAGTTEISPRRRRAIVAGYIFGGIGAVTFVLMMLGLFAPLLETFGNIAVFGWFISLVVFVPACTGLA